MTEAHLSSNTLREAVALASRAPSLFNVQPWRWRAVAGSLELVLDRSRALPETDPTGRELALSNGAALHHAVLALRALGWPARVHRLPNPDEEADLLARIDVVAAAEPGEIDLALAGAACVRQADRRQYQPEPVPAPLLRELVLAGEAAGADVLVAEGDQRYALAQAFMKASVVHGASERYRRELAAWTGLSSVETEGMPEYSSPLHGRQYGDLVVRDYGRVSVAHKEAGSPRTAGSLLLISTANDDVAAHLAAGEATSAVLCQAELEGLASCPLSEAFEVPETRAFVRRAVLHDAGYPQLAIRVGWPSVSGRPPQTPRRPVRELLQDLVDRHPD
ncbi:Acg family FMN-binding oxidoreductase [Saccharopolyspora phatthalungensis]|uniref:Nitroreductase n=1 Tax=Saccharopolyspora phatthalungensis TaxID=664693 RepID=A0A840QG70_9PSEU|nr:nitroreductase family protein [Saccharopolyspora phatthalungensis]MBB5157505.1 nitroreductase [Saccharopolyspora phatthalungensis]